ncbi:MAG: helix-turn-helix domain-containing protein [Actinomycetota bacterium]|nr:helix-turn-helix domain-containing protein [Actinomycetota bacterium]
MADRVPTPPVGRTLKPTEFANLVNAITSAFGDPTRRDIYLLTHEHRDGLTVGDAAAATGLHPNVARHHLDKLVNGGYLEVTHRPSAGAGRPAKVYRASEPELQLEFGVGHDDILVTLLGKALSRLPDHEAAALAEEVGEEFGKQMAASMADATVTDRPTSQRSFRSALHVVADALSAHGFAAHAERHGDELRIVSGHCPFGDVAIEHPVICAVDRGMVRGMLSSLVGETEVVLGTSVARGDDACVTDVQLL